MKSVIRILTVLLTVAAFALPVSAGEVDGHLSDLEEILPPSLSGVTEDASTLADLTGLRAILSEIGAAVTKRQGEVGAFLLLLIACATLSALSGAFGGRLLPTGEAAVGILISVAVLNTVGRLFSEVTASLSSVTEFFGGLIPIMAAITLSGGGASTASVQAAGMGITLSVVSGGFTAALSAVSGLGLAACVLSAFGEHSLPIVRGVRSFFGWLLGLGTALLLGTLSLQTVIASASDSAAMRAGRFALSGMIPVVGGTVSGALSTLASGLSFTKGVVGVSSVLAILTLVLSPLVSLLLYRLALSLACTYADLIGAGGALRSFTAFRSTLDTLIATYALAAVVLLLEIVLFIKSGVAIG